MSANESRCGGRELAKYSALIAGADPRVLLICASHQKSQPAPLGFDTFSVAIQRTPGPIGGNDQAEECVSESEAARYPLTFGLVPGQNLGKLWAKMGTAWAKTRFSRPNFVFLIPGRIVHQGDDLRA